MIFFLVSVLLLIATYWVYKLKVVVTITDEVDDQPTPSRVAPAALRARLEDYRDDINHCWWHWAEIPHQLIDNARHPN